MKENFHWGQKDTDTNYWQQCHLISIVRFSGVMTVCMSVVTHTRTHHTHIAIEAQPGNGHTDKRPIERKMFVSEGLRLLWTASHVAPTGLTFKVKVFFKNQIIMQKLTTRLHSLFVSATNGWLCKRVVVVISMDAVPAASCMPMTKPVQWFEFNFLLTWFFPGFPTGKHI